MITIDESLENVMKAIGQPKEDALPVYPRIVSFRPDQVIYLKEKDGDRYVCSAQPPPWVGYVISRGIGVRWGAWGEEVFKGV